jgi:hypothetical protein
MDGVIYNKKIANTVEQGTGDKCLILEPYTSYEVPLEWGREWNKIRLGVIWSWTSTTGGDVDDNAKYNTPVTDAEDADGNVVYNYGGAIPETNCFFGFSKAGSNKIPLNEGQSGFLGWKGSAIIMSTGTGRADINSHNCLGAGPYVDTYARTYNRPEFHWTKGTQDLSRYQFEYVGGFQFNSQSNNTKENFIAPRIYAQKNPNPSGISPEGEENFATFWGVEVIHTVTNDGNSSYNRVNGYYVRPFFVNVTEGYESFDWTNNPSGTYHMLSDFAPIPGKAAAGNFQYASGTRISDPSVKNLTNIINGDTLQSGTTTNGRNDYVSPDAGDNILIKDNDLYKTDTTDYITYPYARYDIEDPNSPFRVNHQPDSVYFYNGFADLNVRIHSWVAIKIN